LLLLKEKISIYQKCDASHPQAVFLCIGFFPGEAAAVQLHGQYTRVRVVAQLVAQPSTMNPFNGVNGLGKKRVLTWPKACIVMLVEILLAATYTIKLHSDSLGGVQLRIAQKFVGKVFSNQMISHKNYLQLSEYDDK
jgi:hypothetical protein